LSSSKRYAARVRLDASGRCHRSVQNWMTHLQAWWTVRRRIVGSCFRSNLDAVHEGVRMWVSFERVFGVVRGLSKTRKVQGPRLVTVGLSRKMIVRGEVTSCRDHCGLSLSKAIHQFHLWSKEPFTTPILARRFAHQNWGPCFGII
jgi:hypothetical protein